MAPTTFEALMLLTCTACGLKEEVEPGEAFPCPNPGKCKFNEATMNDITTEGREKFMTELQKLNQLRPKPANLDRDPLLVERQKTHGSFEVHAKVTQNLKAIIHQEHVKFNALSYRHREALHMIVHKIGRIMAGDANFKDHWDDIAGYAKLGSEACE